MREETTSSCIDGRALNVPGTSVPLCKVYKCTASVCVFA